MGESNKTPKAQPQIRSHEIISVYNCGGDADYSFSDQLEKRQEEYEKAYRALIKDNGYHISGDYDEWFEAYCTMNEMEINRESAYEKAKLLRYGIGVQSPLSPLVLFGVEVCHEALHEIGVDLLEGYILNLAFVGKITIAFWFIFLSFA